MPGYGPFTPYATGTNGSGAYDVHQTGYLSPPPQEGSVNGDTAGFPPPPFLIDPLSVTVEEPTGLTPGTPVYIWAGFCGAPLSTNPLLGTAANGTKINGLHLTLVTTGTLAATPDWYQVQDIGGTVRWETSSDMTGNTVTLVGVNSWGWQNGGVGADLLQAPLTVGRNSGGVILLGAINVTGVGDMYVGLGYDGISSNLETGGNVVYYPGTETVGIPAGTEDEESEPRVGETPQATWAEQP
jgi:hypothetical protein